MQQEVKFLTDDEPDGPKCPTLRVLASGSLDFYLSVAPRDKHPKREHFFRASTSGSRNPLLTFLVSCMWKLGNGQLLEAATCARAFADQCESNARQDI